MFCLILVRGSSNSFSNVYVLESHPLTLRCNNCHNIVGERRGFTDMFRLIHYREYTVKPYSYQEMCTYGGLKNKHAHRFEYIMRFSTPTDTTVIPLSKLQYGRRGERLKYGCEIGAKSNPIFHGECASYNDKECSDPDNSLSTSYGSILPVDPSFDLTCNNSPIEIDQFQSAIDIDVSMEVDEVIFIYYLFLCVIVAFIFFSF